MPEVAAVPEQVLATEAARELTVSLTAEHGPLIFHQSGGCCDGSSPMCYPAGDLMIGDVDVLLGEVAGAPFYMSRSQFEYWKHTQLTLDVVPGRGGMFSVEGSRGVRFLIRSRVFTGAEIEVLRGPGEDLASAARPKRAPRLEGNLACVMSEDLFCGGFDFGPLVIT